MNLTTFVKSVTVIAATFAAAASVQAQVTVTLANGNAVSGGTLASPGNAQFDFTGKGLASAGTVAFKVDYTDLNSSGLPANWTVTLTSPSGVQSVTLLNNAAMSSFSQTFNSSAFNGLSSGNVNGVWTFNITDANSGHLYQINSGTSQLTITPVPEPSAYAAAFGALALGVGAVRRFKKA